MSDILGFREEFHDESSATYISLVFFYMEVTKNAGDILA